jgi:hypothetical protein
MKMKAVTILISAGLLAMAAPAMADTGPSTTTPPYVLPMVPGAQTTSILTTGDIVGSYKMGGIPDGLGAFDNGDGTFTVLMNHELGTPFPETVPPTGPLGLVRAHGGKGAYVSRWVIDKATLKVIAGEDLMKRVYQQKAGGGWEPVPATGAFGATSSFARFCSADLAPQSAFYAKGKGTRYRIFLNGEESSPTYQRGVAHVVTGPDAGSSYVLPWTTSANAAWENLLANPYSGERTVVIGNADGGTNGVYVYVGAKSRTGNDVERAGLVGGRLYRIAVKDGAGAVRTTETQGADAGFGPALAGTVNLWNFGLSDTDIANASSATSTKFLRPEDGAWDTKDRNRYYFVTTDTTDGAKDGGANPDIAATKVGRSRLWALDFKDSSRPELGGTIAMLLDGTLANGEYQMLDNITVNADGTLILLEDIGNNKHNGKMWKFDPQSGDLVKLARFDTALFGDLGFTGTQTKDEEMSGVIEITRILGRKDGRRYHLFVAQNHRPATGPDAEELLEGGQLLLISQPVGKDDDGERHDDDRDD